MAAFFMPFDKYLEKVPKVRINVIIFTIKTILPLNLKYVKYTILDIVYIVGSRYIILIIKQAMCTTGMLYIQLTFYIDRC